MKQLWKKSLANIKRYYNIFFEDRNPEIIQEDYHADKWISKAELQILLEYEKFQLLKVIADKDKELNDLMASFNLNSYSSYVALEKKYQGKLKKR